MNPLNLVALLLGQKSKKGKIYFFPSHWPKRNTFCFFSKAYVNILSIIRVLFCRMLIRMKNHRDQIKNRLEISLSMILKKYSITYYK